jgi:hypothetical protein
VLDHFEHEESGGRGKEIENRRRRNGKVLKKVIGIDGYKRTGGQAFAQRIFPTQS